MSVYSETSFEVDVTDNGYVFRFKDSRGTDQSWMAQYGCEVYETKEKLMMRIAAFVEREVDTDDVG